MCKFQPIPETHGRSVCSDGLLARSFGEVPRSDHHRLRAWSDASSELRHDAGTHASRDSFRLHRELHGRQPGETKGSRHVYAAIPQRACGSGADDNGVLTAEHLQVDGASCSNSGGVSACN